MQFTAKINKFALSLLVVTGLFAQASVAFASTSSVTCNSATLNGHTATTVFPVSVWFEWGTNSTTVSSGNGTKTASQILNANASFSQPLSGLNPNTTYYYRAMAQDHIGPLAGSVISFTTPSCQSNGQLPTVTTNSASNIDTSSATLNEYVDPIDANGGSRWFEWGTNANNLSNSTSRISINNAGSGSAYISNLSSNVTYYFRAAASNSQGVAYGQVLSFTTNNGGGGNGQVPSATTNSASNINQNSATLNGYVDPNGSSDTVRWFEWGTGYYGFDNTTSQVNINYAGNVSVNLPNLAANTTYRFRVVAQNSQGVTYGQVLSFTTNNGGGNGQLPSVTTNSASSADNYSATLNGYVDPNGTNDTVRWFEWGTSQGNLYNTTSRQNINYAGNVSAYVSNLSPNSTYYYRVVAQNSQGTVYGQVLSFYTNGGGNGNGQLPSVTTNSANSIDNYSASLSGYVDPNGTSDTVRWFEWGTSYSNLYNTTSRINIGYAGSASAYLSNLSSNTTYYFRIAAQNSQGTVYGQVLSFTTQGNSGGGGSNLPLVTTRSPNNVFGTAALVNGYVDPNGSSNVYGWFEWGTNQNLSSVTSRTWIGNNSSNIASNLTGLSANTTYYYRAVAQGDSGTVRGSTLSFTTANTGNNDTSGAPTAITTLPTQITGTSAMLNSLVINSNGDSARAWFEWGTTQSMTQSTVPRDIGSAPSARHAETIYGLVSGRTYYFRVVAENGSGKGYGVIRSFVARTPVVYTPTPKSKTPVKVITKEVIVRADGVNSLVTLTITGGNDTIAKGEHRTYTVTWTNSSTQILRNVILRILVPQTMNFESSDSGTFSKVDSTLTIELNNLNPQDTGSMNLVLNAGESLNVGDLVVTTANMVYTDQSNVQGNALAYTTQRVINGGTVLGASVAGASSFPMTLIGWLLLLILVIILIILSMHLFKKLTEGKAE